MEKLIADLTAAKQTIATTTPPSAHIPIAVVLLNALIDRLQKHVADSKPAANSGTNASGATAVPPVPPAAK